MCFLRLLLNKKFMHLCLTAPCRWLQQRGFDVTYLPVHKDGRVDLKQLQDSIRPDTSLVSVMAVNNEIGKRQTGLMFGMEGL